MTSDEVIIVLYPLHIIYHNIYHNINHTIYHNTIMLSIILYTLIEYNFLTFIYEFSLILKRNENYKKVSCTVGPRVYKKYKVERGDLVHTKEGPAIGKPSREERKEERENKREEESEEEMEDGIVVRDQCGSGLIISQSTV